MHMTIRELQYQNPSHRLTEQLLKWTLFNVLSALSFLHDEANVIHTGKTCGYGAFGLELMLHKKMSIHQILC